MAPTGDPAAHPTPTPTGPRRQRALLGAIAALLLTGISLIGYALAFQQSAPQLASAGSALQQPDRAQPPPPPPGGTGAVVARGPVLPAARPTSISIPSIAVSSVVNEVGLNADGTMEVPQPGPQYDEAAWYRSSPTPGELGPSVIIGHIDSVRDGPSVFFELAKLQPGQRIEVGRDGGGTATFEVDSVASYPKDAFPAQTVYGDTDRAALRLITCGGSFDKARGSYRDNVVVFAHLVP